MKQALRKAFPSTIPVLAGYIFLGIAYGVTLRESGFGVQWALLISTAVYAGSMQFALIGLMTSSFSPLTVALMTLLVNARHLFYGLSMLGGYRNTDRKKPYLIFSLTDETYSLVCNGAPSGIDPHCWYLAVSGLNHAYWITGSVIGALLGQVLPFDLTGIDFAMTALFTVIVTEQTMDILDEVCKKKLKMTEAITPLLLGLSVTTLCLVLLGKESFLVGAMACMLALFLLQYLTEQRRRAS